MSVTPESLRERANAADVAGEETMAEALRNEADELEKNPPKESGSEDAEKTSSVPKK